MTENKDLATKVEGLERENEELKEKNAELYEEAEKLRYDLEWYECECECECGSDEMERQLEKIAKYISEWHFENHPHAFRWCKEEPCEEISELTYGY